MSLVYSGVLSHAPGITGRANLVDNVDKRDEFYAALQNQRSEIITSGAEAIIVIAAEHFLLIRSADRRHLLSLTQWGPLRINWRV